MTISEKVHTFFTTYPARMYNKGEVLIQAGSKPAAYYVANGLVTQYDIAGNGSKLIVNTYKPGSFISLSSMLNNAPVSFYFEATQHTTVHVAPPSDVVDFLQAHPDVVLDTLTRMSRGGEGLMLRLARAMEGSAEGRILQELTIIQSRFHKDGNPITVTDTDLATKTGLARETISRTLKKLDAEGVIRSNRGTISFSESDHI